MKAVDAAELGRSLGQLGTSPRVVVGGNLAYPTALVEALDAACERYRLFVLNAQQPLPDRDGVRIETPFHGPATRAHPRAEYLPMRLSLVPRLFAAERPPDAVFVQTSLPRDGTVSLGVEVNILPAAIEEARSRGGLVVAQLNAAMPHTLGDAVLAVDAVDYALECDAPVAVAAADPPDAQAHEIAERVARLALDGGTIQSGIGRVPDAVVSLLAHRRDLGIWSELVGDGTLSLARAGALDATRPIVGSFLYGSEELLAWADENPRLSMRRTEVVNDPARIAQQPGMLSVNAALEVDLHDQANASHVRGAAYSGFGGQPDFVAGALHAPQGHAVVVLASWHARADCSTIVTHLRSPATSFQHAMVATEQGAARLFGRSEAEQARLLAGIAHPRARDELLEAADRIAHPQRPT